jgi:hypothetical protein
MLATRSLAVTGPMTVFQNERLMRMASALPTRLATRAFTALHRSISNRLQNQRHR